MDFDFRSMPTWSRCCGVAYEIGARPECLLSSRGLALAAAVAIEPSGQACVACNQWLGVGWRYMREVHKAMEGRRSCRAGSREFRAHEALRIGADRGVGRRQLP